MTLLDAAPQQFGHRLVIASVVRMSYVLERFGQHLLARESQDRLQ